MTSEKNIKQWIKQLNDTTNPQLDQRVLADAKLTLAASGAISPTQKESAFENLLAQRNILKPVMAAAVLLFILGGLAFWPTHKSNEGKWWLGSSAAWGQDILTALDTIEGVTCREQNIIIQPDGSEHLSSTWDFLYVSQNSYRRDIYDGDVLREIQWYIPDANGTLLHSIHLNKKCYFTQIGEGSFGNSNPVDRMRYYAKYLDEAQVLLGEKEIEGRHCVGFAISAGQYGDNPEHWIDQIWFDVDTKLPVRIEKQGRPVTDKPDWSITTLQDQFDYDPELPADTFTPWIPEGFIHAHPDNIKKMP